MASRCIAIVLMAFLLTACTPFGRGGPGGGGGPALDRSKLGTASVATVADANNQFAFEMYRELAQEDGNLLFSPYSLSSCLGMMSEGAHGTTASEMLAALHLPADSALRQAGFQTLNEQLNGDHPQFALNVANAVWMQNGYPVNSSYVSTLSQFYGALASNINFDASAGGTINSWVSEQTNGRIPELFRPGAIPDDTVMMLVNAVYFKGRWLEEFKPAHTAPRDFRTPQGTVSSSMMIQTMSLGNPGYFANSELQALELYYRGEDISMLLLLPRADDLVALESSISAEVVRQLRSELVRQPVEVRLPKFRFETDYNLIPQLQALGIVSAFSSERADFSGMSTLGGPYINIVIQKAFIEVNEEGTEAAAATGGGFGATSGPPPVPLFNADHPFIYMIIENTSGLVLFLGCVEDPTAT